LAKTNLDIITLGAIILGAITLGAITLLSILLIPKSSKLLLLIIDLEI